MSFVSRSFLIISLLLTASQFLPLGDGSAVETESVQGAVISPPPAGYLYHGVYPGGVTGEESDVTLDDLLSYEAASGKTAAWVYFSHNWYQGRGFPLATATWIRDAGSVPYIRLMLRSSADQNVDEPLYKLQAIIDGQFDTDFHAWCASARDFASALIAEYGTEVNGEWFSWNGVWNGGGTTNGYGDPTQPDGPERFRDAYRHIIQICRDEGAANITWVFHLNAGDYPEESWNAFENYYPGDDWIDWVGISFYGVQTPMDDYWAEFREGMDSAYPRVDAMTASKPIFVAEFGVAKNNPNGDQAQWARNALTDITTFRWPRLIGFSWWNEYWQNDSNPAHDTTMRLQDNPELATAFQELSGANPIVLGRLNIAGQTFTDVPVTHWAWSWIEALYAAGITGGCSTNPPMYCPDSSVTRAQMAVFLERGMNGSTYTPPAATGTVFTDVPADYWAAAWIEQLFADGITAGCGTNLYCPEDVVTRDQMAIFLLRAEHGATYTPPPAAGVFADVPIDYWAAAWIEQLASEGITAGCGGGNYCPAQPVTRAEMAVFLVRTFNLAP